MNVKSASVVLVACALGCYAALVAHDWMQQSRVQRMLGTEAPSARLVQTGSGATGSLPDFRDASKRILESIVSIDTVVSMQDWFGDVVQRPYGSGSGVIISPEGYIVTNNHVISGPDGGIVDKLTVHLPTGEVVNGRVVGADPTADLAVVKVEKTKLTPVEFGAMKDVEIGQWVIAAGSPMGYENTISVGVVSSLGRTVDAGNRRRAAAQPKLYNLIQTDAAINPGNSGGALVDASGRLLGINTVIASNTGSSVGIGFAIPIDRVRRVTADLIKYGRARYAWLGAEAYARSGLLQVEAARQQISAEVGAQPPTLGALVATVAPGSPADRAGITQLSVITSIDGKKVRDFSDFDRILLDLLPGSSASVEFWKAGKSYKAQVTFVDLANN